MTELRRSLSLPLVVLYGLGVTIGAGIYVLLGAAAGKAGIHAPMAFAFAAVVMAFSAASFAELSARFPVSAGEAAYVRDGFRSGKLSLLVGFLVIASGVVSSAAITVGSTGYVRQFVDLPDAVLIPAIALGLGAIAAWGIKESVVFASLFTVVEAGALIAIIVLGIGGEPEIVLEFPDILPALGDGAAWTGIAGAGLLAFFAFIGFEDMVNLAEEAHEPERNLPKAIFITLTLGTIIYMLVAAVAVTRVPLDALAASNAPLSLVFQTITNISPVAVSAIAIVATLNGVIIQIIMASRVLYGLGRQGSVPAVFAQVSPRTQTPLVATLAVIVCVLVLAMLFPVAELAEWTARVVLVVFALVNAALYRIKRRGDAPGKGHFTAPIWVPVAGVISSLALLAADLIG